MSTQSQFSFWSIKTIFKVLGTAVLSSGIFIAANAFLSQSNQPSKDLESKQERLDAYLRAVEKIRSNGREHGLGAASLWDQDRGRSNEIEFQEFEEKAS